jgi:nitroreductase
MSLVDFIEKIPDIDWKEPVPNINVEEFRKTVMSRRSIRVFEAAPIPEKVVVDCLDMGLLAPNSSNLQPWEFYWVKDPQKKKALVEGCMNQPAARTAAELIVCVARPDTWAYVQNQILEEFAKNPKVPAGAKWYYTKAVPLFYRQGFLGWYGWLKSIFFFFRGFFKPTPREPTSHSDMTTWAVKSSALACENIMLAFRAHGYDSCPMEGMDSKRIKKLLDLPRRSFVTMVIGAGKRAPNGVYGPRLRFKRSQFVKIV